MLELFSAKDRLRKHQIFEKWDDFENRPSCKGYSLCKIVSLGQKVKFKKHAKNDFLIMLELFCAKNRLREHKILGNWDDFENRPSRKGYFLCKTVSLGQKLKFKKTCEKRFFNHVSVVLCKKQLERTQNTRKMRRFWKSAIMQGLWPLQNGQFGSKIKVQKKHGKNDSLIMLDLFCAKNRLRKHQLFGKWDDFENRPSCKGYSFCKMVSLGQKLTF